MEALDALGNPIRREILQALRRGPLSVGELAERFPVSRPAISRHLKVLRDTQLVTVTEEGGRSMCRVDLRGLQSVRSFLDGFWGEALARLEELSRR